MKDVAIFIIGNAACAVFAAGAVLLGYKGKDGWGWFIFAALVLGAINVEGVKE